MSSSFALAAPAASTAAAAKQIFGRKWRIRVLPVALSHSDWRRRRRSCNALTPGGAEIISATYTAAFGAPTVARLSRDDFTRIFAHRVSIPVDIGPPLRRQGRSEP